MSQRDHRSDEVAELVAAWRRERPDLDVTPLEVLSRVTRLARQLDLARRAAFAEHGLEAWGFDVLAALRAEQAAREAVAGIAGAIGAVRVPVGLVVLALGHFGSHLPREPHD